MPVIKFNSNTSASEIIDDIDEFTSPVNEGKNLWVGFLLADKNQERAVLEKNF